MFALLVRQHRATAGFSQEELAERASLSRRGISDLERGARRTPQPATVRRLAEALELTPVERGVFLASARAAHAPGLERAAALSPLPIPPSTFLGRTRELAEVRRLLTDWRLLTITGAGGSGKTRLALEAARATRDDFDDGAALVLLASLASPELVAPAIAHVLGVHDPGGQEFREALISYLRPRHLLLVLDNFEHILGAASLVGELLAACPRLRVLATSREALHLREEQEFPLAPLEPPHSGADQSTRTLLSCPSVELFRQRAAQFGAAIEVTPTTVRAIADICLRLDGLPLAIELAAARSKLLSTKLLLERLEKRLPLLVGGARDLPARQRTLRATIAWSHDLLSADDRRLFRSLSVFAGGCTLAAAEAICKDELGGVVPVIDGLQSLVEKNLVRREPGADDEPRYMMLETIREFALDELCANGELDYALRRHAEYYLTWLAPGDARQLAAHPRGWMRRLDFDYGNLHAAVGWSLDHGCVTPVLAAGAALTRYGHMRGYLPELRAWWQDALERSAGGRPEDWPTAACLLAVVLYLQREPQPVAALLEDSLARFEALGHKSGMAHVLLQLGAAAPLRGDPSVGARLVSQAEVLSRELQQAEDIAWCIWFRGQMAQLEGDLSSAEELCAQALEIVRGVRDPVSVSQAVGLEGLEGSLSINLGAIALLRGELDSADGHLRHAARLGVDLGSPELLAVCVMHLAGVALGRGHAERAACLLGAAEGLWGAVDSGIMPVYRESYNRIRSDLDDRLGEQAATAIRDQGRRMSASEVGLLALSPTDEAPSRDPFERLTPREQEVAELAVLGFSNREIARNLRIAEGTARIHVEHILAKLDLHSRAQLAAWAARGGVLSTL